MLNISKKFLSVLLVVIMVCSLFTIAPFSVSAYANIDGYSDFDVDVYVAGLMIDSDNPLFSTIDNQISLDSPNDVVINQLKEDTGFQASYAAWQIATFKGGDAISDPLTEVGYYQSLIINTISEALTSSNVKNAFDNTVIKDAKHLQSTFTNILKLEFVFTDLNDLNVAEMSQDEQIKVMDAFSSSFKKTYPAVSDVGKFVSAFSTIVKEGKALETAINNLVAYTESVGMTDYMKAVVSDLYKNCDSSNVAMKSALFEIDKACQSYELAYSAATFDAAISSLSVVCEKVVNTMVDGIMAANPAGLSIMIGQAIGKGVANFLFSTDAICEQYHKMCCLYEFEELLGKVTKLEMDSFTKSKTNYNANKIFSAVDFLYKEYDVSCDLAKKYADIIFKESIAGVFLLNSDGYNKYISSVESLRSIAEDNYEFLKGDAWMCFLEEDYPDIYNALIKDDEEIKNPYIPVTKIAFEKKSVEWGTQDTFLNNDKATINPSNASSKGIEYTSSDPSVVSYNKFGAVVHKAGTATVTATSVSSGLTATLNVTVVDGNGADGIALEDPDSDDSKINYDDTFTINNITYYITSEDKNTVEVYKGKVTGKVVIPETVSYKNRLFSVTEIADKAFLNCESLESIIIHNGVISIGTYAFGNCYRLTKVKIPYGVTELGNGAFTGCFRLTNVIIPDSVKKINNAFMQCGIKSIAIPDSVTSISENAFQRCVDLISVTIGNGVTSIGEYTFSGCASLTRITIPDGVTSIGKYAFSDCASLTRITIPDGVTSIGEYAFSGCASLAKIAISDSVTDIGYRSFHGTTWYNNQPNGLIYAGKVAYCYKGKMPENTSIVLKDDTKGIVENAFYGCTNLTSITIPDSVTYIGDRAFWDCTSLANITISDSVIKIGVAALTYTAWYNNQPNGVVYAGKVAYDYKGEMPENTSIILKEGTKGIANYAFEDCKNLTSIIIPKSMAIISNGAFWGCTNLKSITIPDSVTSIGGDAFCYCESLASVTIGNGVTSIGFSAYNFCKSLTSVTIGKGVTNIGNRAFDDCTNLKDVYYSGSEEEWNNINIYADNERLKNATIHFHSEDPTETIVDENTGISVTTNSAAKLMVENLTDSDSVKNVITLLDKSEKLADLYDISLTKDGVAIQPDEPATVKIPTNNENAKVYRIENNGTATDKNAVYDNGYMVFTTEHFSLYALVIPKDNVIGDVNGDGEISLVDATELQKYLVGLSSLSVDQLAVADANGDGKISIIDATEIQKYLVGLVSSLG